MPSFWEDFFGKKNDVSKWTVVKKETVVIDKRNETEVGQDIQGNPFVSFWCITKTRNFNGQQETRTDYIQIY